ncbi:MAG: ABC transporter permease [Lachnospiraceae bacterium]|nr:ABC transporter permease [Lachnospiraceae bacterium]
MQSKTSFFSTVVKKNLTRFWPLWGIATFFWLLIPFAFLMNFSRDFYDSSEGAGWFYGGATTGLPFFLLIYSCFVAMAVWSYLYTGKSVGLMHSLPITRNELFAANFVSGLIMIFIPVGAAGMVLAIFQIVMGGFPVTAFLLTAVIVLAESLFFFAFATFVAHLTGNVLALPILYFILNFLAVIIEYEISVYASLLCYGLDDTFNGNASFLSPVIHLMMYVDYVDRSVSTPGRRTVFSPEYQYIEGWDSIGLYALVAVVLIAVSIWLYRRRKSETAGEVVSARTLRPIALYCFTVCAALTGGILLFAIFGGFDRYQCAPLLALCMIISALIGYYGGLMLIKRKLKVFDRKSLYGMIVVAVACVFFIALLRADAFKREKVIPKQERVDYVHVYVDGLDLRIPGDEAHRACYEEITKLHSKCIENKAIIIERKNEMLGNGVTDEEYCWLSVRFSYYLKNGKQIVRDYDVIYKPDPEGVAPGSIEEAIAAFSTNRDLQLQSMYVDSGLTPEYVFIDGLDLNRSDANAIYKAVIEDIKDGNYGNPMPGMADVDVEWALDFSLTLSKDTPDSNSGVYREYGDWINLVIHLTPKMKHTVEYLESKGLDCDATYAGSYSYY